MLGSVWVHTHLLGLPGADRSVATEQAWGTQAPQDSSDPEGERSWRCSLFYEGSGSPCRNWRQQ